MSYPKLFHQVKVEIDFDTDDSSTSNVPICPYTDLSKSNFWLLLYFPSDETEFEILHGNYLERDSLEGLSKGSEVNLRIGDAIIQGYIVSANVKRSYLEENFSRYTEEFREEFAATILNVIKETKNRNEMKNINVSSTIQYFEKQVIEVADKETQTFSSGENSDSDIYQKYHDLQRKHAKVLNLLEDVSSNLSGTLKTLKKCQKDSVHGTSSQGRVPFGNSENDENCSNNGTTQAEVGIGPGGTKISSLVFRRIKWYKYTCATRKLLMTFFPREILATHSLTGKPSPIHKGTQREEKKKLDSTIINDIVYIVSKKCGVSESRVRGAITTKCADENKMYKSRLRNNLNDDEEDAAGDVKKHRV